MLIKTLNFYSYTQLLIKSKEIHIFISIVGITDETCVKKKSTVSITIEIGGKKKIEKSYINSHINVEKNKLNILSTVIKR